VAALAAFALGAIPAAAAQADPDSSALRNATTRAEILRHAQRLQAVALSNENNRLTASAGNLESLDYVITKLREYGYNPTLLPYANASTPNAWSEKTPSVLEQVTPTAKAYTIGVPNDFAAMTWSTNADFTAQVIPAKRIQIPPPPTNNTVRSGCSMDDFPPEVKDNIVLVQRGFCTELVKVINARASGAKAILIMNEGQPGRTNAGTSATGRFTAQTYPGFPAMGVSFAVGSELVSLAAQGPVTLHFKTDVNLTQRIDYDILAETEAGDPTKILQVGAHIDGVAAGPGINDDGSGTSMNLTIAHQIKKLGLVPQYKIRFGWFSGEEQGLFGSQYLVNQINSRDLSSVVGMLDYDMIASTNYVAYVYDGAASNAPPGSSIMENVHTDFIHNVLGKETLKYPFDGRSDYGGWIARQVPATGLYTGAERIKTDDMVRQYGGQAGIQQDPCYHEWCDTVFNLSQYGLSEFSKVLAHGVWSFAGPGPVTLPAHSDG
jgi:Zn-dependent M28 family amino/carboxypeptidase